VAWFRCSIHGESFPGQLIGEAGLVGFYTARFVEATDADAAETNTLLGLRADPKLTLPADDAPSGQAKVYFEEIEEIAAERVPLVQPGFVFYLM
jgi:hypothetical protein